MTSPIWTSWSQLYQLCLRIQSSLFWLYWSRTKIQPFPFWSRRTQLCWFWLWFLSHYGHVLVTLALNVITVIFDCSLLEDDRIPIQNLSESTSLASHFRCSRYHLRLGKPTWKGFSKDRPAWKGFSFNTH